MRSSKAWMRSSSIEGHARGPTDATGGAAARASAPVSISWIQRPSFCPDWRSTRDASVGSRAARASRPWPTSAVDEKGWRRSVRVRTSSSVWEPRSRTAQSTRRAPAA